MVRIIAAAASSPPWEDQASAKRAGILGHIPEKWRLSASDLERAGKQRDQTGAFIQGFLDQRTFTIVTPDTAAILLSLQKRELSAVQVTTAFCQASAVAQQIVSGRVMTLVRQNQAKPITTTRTIAFTKSSSRRHLVMHGSLMTTSKNTIDPSVHFMDCRSVSKINTMSRALTQQWAMLDG